jgi:hypothetical protein
MRVILPSFLLLAFAIFWPPPAARAADCGTFYNTCVTEVVTAGGDKRTLTVTVAPSDDRADWFNAVWPGHDQIELDFNQSFSLAIPADGVTRYSVQACWTDVWSGSICNGWYQVTRQFGSILAEHCPSGQVWRERFDGDSVCVTPDERYRMEDGSCRSGWVWRDSFPGDGVCVTVAERDALKQAARANRKIKTTGKAKQAPEPADTSQFATANDDVDIYEGPDGDEFPVIGSMNEGERAKVLGEQDGWYHLQTDPEGWVAADHLSVE